jgi:hypothetical protein
MIISVTTSPTRIETMNHSPIDQTAASRWFAVECNNQAWDAVEANELSSDAIEQMLHAAHASVFHWGKIGNQVHRLRGLTLLVAAYVKAKLPESATLYAEKASALWEVLSDCTETTDFDHVCVLGAATSAARLRGETPEQLAQEYAAVIRKLNEEDRKVAEGIWEI